MTIDQKIERIAKEVKKLSATTPDKPISRRNARARVLSALRAVRAHIDEEFPPIVSREGVKRLTPEGRIARLKRQGWVKITGSLPSSQAGEFSLHGVPVKTVRVSNPQQDGKPIKWSMYFVPRWADEIGVDDLAKLRAAVKSRTFRRAVLTEAAILQNG